MSFSVQQKYITAALHTLIWSALLLLPYFVSNAENNYRIGVMPGAFFTLCGLVHMGIFYSNAFFLYPKVFNRRWWWLYIPASALLLALASAAKFTMVKAWFPDLLANGENARFVFGPSMLFFVISIVYRRILDKRRSEQLRKERQAAQLQTELKFLRSQISPHFLFNVLTNLVSLARKKSDRLEEALIMLAEMMRYMLYDTQGKKVPLQKEIDYLNSYIALQRLRFGSDILVHSHISTPEKEHDIEPMLLIPFVENAFKHGTAEIGIRLSVQQEVMTFEVFNQFLDEPPAAKDDSSGIGLSNVRSRLDLLYAGKYKLAVNKTDTHFQITLILHLYDTMHSGRR